MGRRAALLRQTSLADSRQESTSSNYKKWDPEHRKHREDKHRESLEQKKEEVDKDRNTNGAKTRERQKDKNIR